MEFILLISLLLSPLQVLKVRLNLQQAGTYHGVVAGARSIYRHESLSSFYRGFKPSILCMIPYAGVECAVHQVRQNEMKHVFICKILNILNYLLLICSPSWTGQRVIRPTTVTPNCFSSVLWPLLLDRWPVTHWQWSGLSNRHKVHLFVTHFEIIWNNSRCFTHLCLSCFAAFSSDSRPASGVLQGLIGIYERRGIRGYYNGMGASFVRAIPCALINYTLTRQFENLVSSTESWDLEEEVLLSLCAELFFQGTKLLVMLFECSKITGILKLSLPDLHYLVNQPLIPL